MVLSGFEDRPMADGVLEVEIDEAELTLLAAGIEESIESSRADNTKRAYLTRFDRFARWATARGLDCLPADPYTIALYAETLVREGKALSTVKAYLSTVSMAHRLKGVQNPCGDPRVRLYMDGKTRQFAGRRQKQALALSENDIMNIMVSLPRRRVGRSGHLESESVCEVRAAFDKALLLTMVQAGLRRSEAEDLCWDDIGKAEDGSGRVTIRRGKTDQTGQGAVVAVKENCLEALEGIRPAVGDAGERIFGLSGVQIYRRLKAMCAGAGMVTERVTGHTPRVTLARLMSEKGAPTHIIQKQGRWETPGMVMLYTRAAQAGEALRWL